MLAQYSWLSSLPLIASAIGHAYPPIGLKPRYLSTGTAISLPSTSAPPYPTGTASGTAIPTGSTTTSSTTPTSKPSSGSFYLVVANTGTDLDGNWIQLGGSIPYNGGVVLFPVEPPDDVSLPGISSFLFGITADGYLLLPDLLIAYIYTGLTYPDLTPGPDGPDQNNFDDGSRKVICEVVDGTLTCQVEMRSVFSICADQSVNDGYTGGPLELGPTVDPGCSEVTLLAVPV